MEERVVLSEWIAGSVHQPTVTPPGGQPREATSQAREEDVRVFAPGVPLAAEHRQKASGSGSAVGDVCRAARVTGGCTPCVYTERYGQGC